MKIIEIRRNLLAPGEKSISNGTFPVTTSCGGIGREPEPVPDDVSVSDVQL